MITARQKLAFKKVLENGRQAQPRPVGVVLREVGYRKLSEQPRRILESKGFQELKKKYKDLMEESISMEKVVIEHKKIIEQDRDSGAKLNGIRLYIEKAEPEDIQLPQQQVNIILEAPKDT